VSPGYLLSIKALDTLLTTPVTSAPGIGGAVRKKLLNSRVVQIRHEDEKNAFAISMRILQGRSKRHRDPPRGLETHSRG
jgi:hypothetical protein